MENDEPNYWRSGCFIIAMLFVEVYFAGPSYAFYRYYHGRLDVKYLPTFQICANLLNCMLWVINAGNYPDQEDSFLKYTCNILGLSFSIIFVCFTWIIYSKKNIQENGIYLFAFCNIIFQIYFVLSKVAKQFIIIISISVNIAIYLAPVQHLVSNSFIHYEFII